MARKLSRRNSRSVMTIKKQGRHADGGGLYLVVDKSGAKRWVFLFHRRGDIALTSSGVHAARHRSSKRL
jgi:hypothetical protein